MASAEHEPRTGVWGQSPQRGTGAEPLVRGWSPPEAESILVIGCPTEPVNLAPFQKCPFELRYTPQSLTGNSMLCYGQLVSELGGAECMMPPPTPSLGGCAPRPSAPPPMCIMYFTLINQTTKNTVIIIASVKQGSHRPQTPPPVLPPGKLL